MEQLKNNEKKQFSQLKYAERQIIEKLLKTTSAKEIALLLNVHRTTIERDIKLGLVTTRRTIPDEVALVGCLPRKY